MSDYRYQLERYRGRGTRHTCPQCHRKQSFTRYIDTHNNNEYINNNVGKCNRLDKGGYHYTPKQYFTDNPWKRDSDFFSFSKHRDFEKKKIEKPQPKAEPTKREFEREKSTTTMRVDTLFTKRASPNLTGIKNNTRVVVGRSGNA